MAIKKVHSSINGEGISQREGWLLELKKHRENQSKKMKIPKPKIRTKIKQKEFEFKNSRSRKAISNQSEDEILSKIKLHSNFIFFFLI